MSNKSLTFIIALVVVLLPSVRAATLSPAQFESLPSAPWRFLYQNNGDWAARNQASFLLYPTTTTSAGAVSACTSVSESLITVTKAVDAGLQRQLAFTVYDKSFKAGQKFWVAGGKAIQINTDGSASLVKTKPAASVKLPAICTQSAPRQSANNTVTSTRYQQRTASWAGYRDGRSFRFGGIPYARPVDRFAYSEVLTDANYISALLTDRSSQCPQTAGTDKPYTEDCLLLNIYTPAIGASQSKSGRPVMVWLHGGGFISGSGLDFTFDGGELSSRGDAVVVTINYRLGSLGFLSINGQAQGNYAVGDAITALQWVQKYISNFGGDPSRVLLYGQSAGAQIVEALLASPKASGLFSSAIVQSGRPQDRTNALQTASVAQAGSSGSVIKALGCGSVSDVLGCLRGLPASSFLRTQQFSKPVVDGNIITSDTLDVAAKRGGHVNKVPVIFGFMRDEAGSLGYVPPRSQALDAALAATDLTQDQRMAVQKNLNIFPPDDVRNITITAQTDAASIKRCGQESMLMAAAKSGVFSAVYGYTQNQRAMQIPNYDPNAVCSASNPKSSYYL